MERLKRSLTGNLDSERSTSTLSRSSSREWLDALEKELSPADQSSGDFSVKLSAPPRAPIDDNISISANFGVGEVLKRALTLNEEKEAAAAQDANGVTTRKKRGGRRKSSFGIFSNRNNDPEKDTKSPDEAKSKQLGCVWKVQDIRQSYSDIIYRRRSSNFSANKNNNEEENSRGYKSRQNQRNSMRSSISSLCSSLRGSDVLNLPKEYDIDDETRKDCGGDDVLPLDTTSKVKNTPQDACSANNNDSFSTLASIEEQMRTRYTFTGRADR